MHPILLASLAFICATTTALAQQPTSRNAKGLGTLAYQNDTFQLRCHEAALCEPENATALKNVGRDLAGRLTSAHDMFRDLNFNESGLVRDTDAREQPFISIIARPGICGQGGEPSYACARGLPGATALEHVILLPEDNLQASPNLAVTMGHEYAHTLDTNLSDYPFAKWWNEALAETMGRAYARRMHKGYDPDTDASARVLDQPPYKTSGYGFASYIEHMGATSLGGADGFDHLRLWYNNQLRAGTPKGTMEFMYRYPSKTANGKIEPGPELPEQARYDKLFPRYVAETANDPDDTYTYSNVDSFKVDRGVVTRTHRVNPFAASPLNFGEFIGPETPENQIDIVTFSIDDADDPKDLTLVYEGQVINGHSHSVAIAPFQAKNQGTGFLRVVNAGRDPDQTDVQDFTLTVTRETIGFDVPACVEFNQPIVVGVVGGVATARNFSLQAVPGNGHILPLRAPAVAGPLDIEVVVEPAVTRTMGTTPEVLNVGTVDVRESCDPPEPSNIDISMFVFDWSLNACEVLWATYQQMERELGDGTTAFQGVNVYQVMPPGTLREPGLQAGCALTLRLLNGSSVFGSSSQIPLSPALLRSLKRHAAGQS